VNQTIKTLLKIQEIDKSIHEIKEEIRNIEDDVKAKEDSIKAVAKEIEEIELKIDALIKDKEYNEQLVEDKNSQIEALNNKSSLVKNQKEQRALEIEMEELTSEYKLFSKNASDKIKKLSASVEGYTKKRLLLFNAIDDATARQYEEINRWAEGNAMSEIKSESCMGCFLMLPPQVSATVMETEQLVFCPNCGRILYINDES